MKVGTCDVFFMKKELSQISFDSGVFLGITGLFIAINSHLSVPGYHGTSGPTKVTDADDTPEIVDALVKAGQEIGERATDYNGKEQKGA